MCASVTAKSLDHSSVCSYESLTHYWTPVCLSFPSRDLCKKKETQFCKINPLTCLPTLQEISRLKDRTLANLSASFKVILAATNSKTLYMLNCCGWLCVGLYVLTYNRSVNVLCDKFHKYTRAETK